MCKKTTLKIWNKYEIMRLNMKMWAIIWDYENKSNILYKTAALFLVININHLYIWINYNFAFIFALSHDLEKKIQFYFIKKSIRIFLMIMVGLRKYLNEHWIWMDIQKIKN